MRCLSPIQPRCQVLRASDCGPLGARLPCQWPFSRCRAGSQICKRVDALNPCFFDRGLAAIDALGLPPTTWRSVFGSFWPLVLKLFFLFYVCDREFNSQVFKIHTLHPWTFSLNQEKTQQRSFLWGKKREKTRRET